MDIDVPEAEPRLVIDALIAFSDDALGLGLPLTVGDVTLTLSSPFFIEDNPPALGAVVEITDEFTGTVFVLEEEEPGVFSDNLPQLEFGRDYTLRVTYEGEVFEATQRLVASGEILSTEQSDGFLFDEETETEVVITFMDVPNERTFFLFSFGFENFLVTDDQFFQDSFQSFSFFYDDVNPGDVLPITLFGIDEDFSVFANQALVQAGVAGGGPFFVPPGNVRGNILNVTNQGNFPFGYFALSEFDTEFLTVE